TRGCYGRVVERVAKLRFAVLSAPSDLEPSGLKLVQARTGMSLGIFVSAGHPRLYLVLEHLSLPDFRSAGQCNPMRQPQCPHHLFGIVQEYLMLGFGNLRV